jgi:hypothetical protein
MVEEKMTIKVYCARAMTNRIEAEVVAEARRDKAFLELAGLTVLDPVAEEKVKPTGNKLVSNKAKMDKYWPRDKQMIREANVLLDMSPNVPSMGVIREHGYARYHLWKKVVSVFPKGQVPPEWSVCQYEDDYVTDDLRDAVMEIYRTHGTLWKRLKWRAGIYWRSWPKAKWHRMGEWK